MASAVRSASRHLPSSWPGGFFLTDPHRVPDPVAAVRHLPPSVGVIYRHFGEEHRFDIATKLVKICRIKDVPLLIANDPHLARVLKADGVHWPEAHAHHARQWRSRFLFQTQSVHSASGMRQAICDAVLFSTVFPSNSPSAGKAMGAARFRALARSTDKLVYALGGVNGRTAGGVTSVAGLAAIEGFTEPVLNHDRV